MHATDELLRTVLHLIRKISRARSASLYLPMPPVPGMHPVLLHEGGSAAIPELADLDEAERFHDAARQAPSDELHDLGWMKVACRPSSAPGCHLIRIPCLETLLASVSTAGDPAERRRSGDGTGTDGDRSIHGEAWLGLCVDEAESEGEVLRTLFDPGTTSDARGWWTMIMALGSSIAWQSRWISTLLVDPVTQLPGRVEFQAFHGQSRGAVKKGCRTGLLLINPDDFGSVNERLGRDSGDAVIRMIGQRLRESVRRTDFAFRYGAAVFGLLVPSTTEKRLQALAGKLREELAAEPYLEGAVRLTFSFGLALEDPEETRNTDEAGLELIRRSDRALNAARRAGGGRAVLWRPEPDIEEVGQLDRLAGIFTADPSRDYRNMSLLWDVVELVSTRPDREHLRLRILKELGGVFKPSAVALIDEPVHGSKGGLRQGILWRCGEPGDREWEEDPDLDPERTGLMLRSREAMEPVTGTLQGAGAGPEHPSLSAYVVPLVGTHGILGYLFLEGPEGQFQLTPSDLVFLGALSGQLALALDRERLFERERLRSEQETRQLKIELNNLRAALKQSDLIHGSQKMKDLLVTTRRVAETGATVLIHGESGVGKEMVARTVHELSPRKDRPLVVVDCGAIATSLIDSELFGHEKGAYTGADQRTAGRLAEADGGTLLLDEVGELPLEVQSKLLRFVQEKQFTPVGSSRPRSVDVRVVGITNRNLAAEVEAGRFREDLYYRLNVVQLVVPPLRERTEDILLLARHFTTRFCTQFEKRDLGMTHEAEAILLRHTWPGNVRELQNRIMRAVVLCDGLEIGVQELELTGVGAGTGAGAGIEVEEDPFPPEPPAGETDSLEQVWARIREDLSRRIESVLDQGATHQPPLGKWLGEDLVVEAYRNSENVSSRAASLLGIPETTFRRRLRKAEGQRESGLSPRPADWDSLQLQIAVLVEAGNAAGEDLLEKARQTLLEELEARISGNVRTGSAFMGVTEPTYRKWLALYRAET